MQRTSSSYSIPSSLAESKIRGWNGLLSDIFSMHSEPCVLVHFRNTDCLPRWKMHQLCWDVERLWHYTMGVRKRSLETLITDSLSPAAPLGTHPTWLLGCVTWAAPSAVRQTLPVICLGTKQRVGSVCCSLSCYGRTCKFVGSAWSEQTLVFFRTLLCRQGN